jgi:hypothetical protein
MSNQRPNRNSMSIEEATVSHMWEIAAIVEVLEQKASARSTREAERVVRLIPSLCRCGSGGRSKRKRGGYRQTKNCP